MIHIKRNDDGTTKIHAYHIPDICPLFSHRDKFLRMQRLAAIAFYIENGGYLSEKDLFMVIVYIKRLDKAHQEATEEINRLEKLESIQKNQLRVLVNEIKSKCDRQVKSVEHGIRMFMRTRNIPELSHYIEPYVNYPTDWALRDQEHYRDKGLTCYGLTCFSKDGIYLIRDRRFYYY